MSDALSAEQIAALVAAAKEGDATEAAPTGATRRKPRRVRAIDFSRPNKFGQDQQRRLLRAHETFCRTASSRLSAELMTPIELEVLGVDQLTWTTAAGQVPPSSICAVVSLDRVDTRVLLTVELPLVLRLLERLLGGGGSTKPSTRELTEIELTLLRRILHTFLAPLSATWHELADIDLSLAEIESQLQNVNLASPSEPTLVITMEAKVDRSSSTISLLLPHRSIEPVADQLSVNQLGDGVADRRASDAVRAQLAAVDVEVRAEIASREMTVDEVLTLRPGDVLRFGAPASSGVTVFTGDVPSHRGQPGRSANRRAVQILERLEAPDGRG